jgi:hypothetical protein
LGVDVAGAEVTGKEMTQRRDTVRLVADAMREEAFQTYLGWGVVSSQNPDVQQRAFETFYNKFIASNEYKGLAESVELYGASLVNQNKGTLYNSPEYYELIKNFTGTGAYIPALGSARRQFGGPFTPSGMGSLYNFSSFAPVSYLSEPEFMAAFSEALKKEASAPQLAGLSAGGGVTGDDIKGYNRDRRSLEIHFHDAIVEWNSTINTDNPEEVVQEVSSTIEDATSRAIQIAILGASQKMNMNWY